MIHPTDEQLLTNVVAALTESVLPELARGSAARKQLQAALEILRRIAFAMPDKEAALDTDNADIAETIGRMEAVMLDQSPPPNPPPSRGRAQDNEASTLEKRLPLDGGGRPAGPGGGDLAPSAADTNIALQAKLAGIQANAANNPEITALLTALYSRMTDRALALIPPPPVRTPRTPS